VEKEPPVARRMPPTSSPEPHLLDEVRLAAAAFERLAKTEPDVGPKGAAIDLGEAFAKLAELHRAEPLKLFDEISSGSFVRRCEADEPEMIPE
jgi:hypothetical protein